MPFPVWKSKTRTENERLAIFTEETEQKTQAAYAKYGLVFPAISRHAFVQVYAGMVKTIMPHMRRSPVKAERGIIRGMSSKSRKRMMEAIAQWRDFDHRTAYFITITYHEEWGVSFEAWKRDIEVFVKRMKRKFDNTGGLWKLEFQQRGAPHFHLIVSGLSRVHSEVMEWVTKNWGEIAHQNSEYRGLYATNVRRITSLRHAMHYAAKYMTKSVPVYVNPDEETGELELIPTGRIWAVFGNVDRTPIIAAITSPNEAINYRRAVALHLIKNGSRYADRFNNHDEKRSWSAFGIGMREGDQSIKHWRELLREQYQFADSGT